jgi:putative ABC transport system permease protein
MLLSLALRNIARQVRTSLVLIATIAVGIFGVLMFDAFSKGIMLDYRTKIIYGLQAHGQLAAPGYYLNPPSPPHKQWISNVDALRSALREGPGVVDAFPRLRFMSFLTRGKANIVAMGQGVDGPAETQFFTMLPMGDGELLGSREDGIVLGSGLAKALDAKVGDTVTVLTSSLDQRLNGVDLKVVGIFRVGMANLDDRLYMLPIAQAQRLLETDKVESLAIGLRSLDGWDAFQRWFDGQKLDFEIVRFEEMDKVYYQNSVRFLDNQFVMMLTVFAVLLCLGVFNFMSSRVYARGRQIGMLRANGESVNFIRKLYVTEAAIVGVLGSFLGVAIALVVVKVLLKQGIYMPPAPGFADYYYAKLHLGGVRTAVIAVLGPIASALGTCPAIWLMTRRSLPELLRM